ncbi:HLA class II histocompatibility antigen, DQ beta 1 chain-like isoform X2 [Stegastes partitus]|uniref:HLA class II histocompatibility antigen, DQ beta 1 chain-like n=1 Tax=Stegastes partitus TaxID=144197 RepID=A0A3B4ZV62_9TELE|nr:PREDICTED: HLA class II histocompatibility antigen, DQ beta 1 chain-like isoform X2 [Stegastes partitus]
MDPQRLLSLILLFLSLQQKGRTADDDYFHILMTCQFVERGSQTDVNYGIQYQYNGRLQAQYNSSTETVVGFTRYGQTFAGEVNKDPDYLRIRKYEEDFYCKILAAQLYGGIQGKAVPPVSRMRSDRSGDSELLVCSSYNFYPPQIRQTWLKDGVVMADPPVSMVTEMPGGAWRYQVHSHLKVSPASGNFTCMVEHISLPTPQLLEPKRPESNTGPMVLGGVFLGLGLLVLLLSTGFYWRKTRSTNSSSEEQNRGR